ncbi:hypothetical protein GN958_ATG10424 [Phytophthora infestans]|uniref:Uncharacterized protein n=1 Tax=Phytophthora infestans TaxID=4787 RepID=A0A8S9ULR3_PHYIN|nr:hypothetical protein GN958_ATG10424 [Phytophthora infestans]
MWPSLFQRLQEIRALRASGQPAGPGRTDGGAGEAASPDSDRRDAASRRAPQRSLTSIRPRSQTHAVTPPVSNSTNEQASQNGEEVIASSVGASRASTVSAGQVDQSTAARVPPHGSSSAVVADAHSVRGIASDMEVANIKPPAAVTNAIAAFPEVPGLVLKPPTEKETSYIYKWGVRVEVVERGVPVRHWICLADETCRRNGTNFTLSCDRTSKPANHLAAAH